MKRVFSVAALISVGAIAMAATTIVGAFGQGRANNAAGHRSEFHFSARKATNGNVVRVEGFARFIAFSGTNDRPRHHGIFMPEVRAVGKSNNICQFGGPAQMQVRDGNNYHMLRGHVVFNVADRRNSNTGGEPDRISVRFTDLHNRVWDYTGFVYQGDIVVFERTED